VVKVIWTERAVDDLTSIANYCERHSSNYAASIVSKLFKRVNILKTMPEIGRIVPEKNDDRIRELIEGNYRIIYQFEGLDKVEILLVHHSSRPLSTV
jgi:toxin ParE1/3/4